MANISRSLGPKTREKWQEALDALPAMPDKIPAFFFAHGSPMLAFSDSTSRSDDVFAAMGPKGNLALFLSDFGPALLQKYNPKGIVVFSAHWETEWERLGMLPSHHPMATFELNSFSDRLR
jgi:aromatic ring-opening dioxygenase catalytic subunit (LigB family)